MWINFRRWYFQFKTKTGRTAKISYRLPKPTVWKWYQDQFCQLWWVYWSQLFLLCTAPFVLSILISALFVRLYCFIVILPYCGEIEINFSVSMVVSIPRAWFRDHIPAREGQGTLASHVRTGHHFSRPLWPADWELALASTTQGKFETFNHHVIIR